LILLLLASCARTTMQSSVADEHGGVDEFAELDFWDGLAEVRTVTNRDAVHALLLSTGHARPEGDYAAEVGVARERGWVPEDWDRPANETARVGWIAKAICKEYEIRGGVNMRIFGPRRRFAVNELVWLGLLPQHGTGEALGGLELISLLSNVEDYEGKAPTGPEDLE
jgi:hypothetical protein